MNAVRHQCMIYEGSPVKHLPGIAWLLAQKLNSNVRCLYLNSPAMVAGVRSYLAAAGINVAGEAEKGSLVLSSDESHLVNGRFDVDRMIVLLEDAIDKALDDGYDGLFATGDMTWEFGPEKNFAKLKEYEERLEQVFQARPELQGICQYHTQTLPPDIAEIGLRTHRACYINQTLSLMNQHYTASTSQISPGQLREMMARPREQAAS